MSKHVNTPRLCIICGREFYPSMSGSLFHCEDQNCHDEYNVAMDECSDLNLDDEDEEE